MKDEDYSKAVKAMRVVQVYFNLISKYSTILNESGITATSREIGELSNNTTYYWQVNAANAGRVSGWSETWNFTTVPAVNVSDITLIDKIRIYSNPAIELLTVEFDRPLTEKVEVALYNITGSRLLSQLLVNSKNEIDISGFSRGLYLIEIKNENSIVRRKVIME